MKRVLRSASRLLLSAAVCLAVVAVFSSVGVAQDKKITETAGVNNTKMGAYEALAQMSYQAFKSGDNATAAELARVLERTWDAAEGGGGDNSLGKTNKDLFGEIDKSMDGFIKPVMHYASKAPDPASVEAAYKTYIDKLKQAD